MKTTSLFLNAALLGVMFAPTVLFAQQALKTDPAGNPTTLLNLGGDNVTGTLAADRLPAGVGAPVVRVITQTQGSATLAAGTNVAVLSAPLTGALNLRLPAASTYPAGRALVIVDPDGYSNAARPVAVLPGGGDLLNGLAASAGATPVLTGAGAATCYPDGATRWSSGQSLLRAPSLAGLTLTGPARDISGTLLSVRDGPGNELLSVRGDSNVNAANLNAGNLFSSDAASIYTDGEGALAVGALVSQANVSACWLDLQPVDPTNLAAPVTGARLYVGTDGKLHVRTPDNADHILTRADAP